MPISLDQIDDFDLSFKVYYDLMARRVSEILLVSSSYDAFIMDEDGRLAERIIHEYRGLNLTRPPRLTWVSTTREAFEMLSRRRFDLVITMPRLDDMDPYDFGKALKKKFADLPVYLLTHYSRDIQNNERFLDKSAIDKVFVWKGNAYLLLAMIKNTEDRLNVAPDTHRAMVRVIILVEDSPGYLSSLLPLLYMEIVSQTNCVIEESLNEEHRILRMRARPKILVAESFEEAEEHFRWFKPYVLSVISDVRFPRDGKIDGMAGVSLLSKIRAESPDMPLLMLSAEPENREHAEKVNAVFINKNSPFLNNEIRAFMVRYLGFGDFVFQMPDGKEVVRVGNLRAMEKALPKIPMESIHYHAKRNDFSSWLMARSEIQMATKLRPITIDDFSDIAEVRDFLIACLRMKREGRQKGIVADFIRDRFDPDTDCIKIGKGSLGGKARGLAFIMTLMKDEKRLRGKFSEVKIVVPKLLVISTEYFDAVIRLNNLKNILDEDVDDERIKQIFLNSRLPDELMKDLESFVTHVTYPLAVRSSSLLEDARFQAHAGIYSTYMIPNNDPDPAVRLRQLADAVKLVYASTYMERAKVFSKSTHQRTEEEKMAVIIQQLIGYRHGDYFYPAISGVAQSYNFYPVSDMKPEHGIVHIALGLGKTVMEGGASLRFCPRFPNILPQFSTVSDIMKNAQRQFYALKMTETAGGISESGNGTLVRLEHDEDAARNHYPVRMLTSTYVPEDNRIRDTSQIPGVRVLTFANILKHGAFPLPEIVSAILDIGRKGMGCPVEIEFAVNICADKKRKPEFALLQIRPMALARQNMEVDIGNEEIKNALCYSTSAMGNGIYENIADIVFVSPENFDPAQTVEIAMEIRSLNSALVGQNRKYLLVGPGRWGSADRWLGIPVAWNDISGVGAMVETSIEQLKADPSQGSHFFNNIVSLGICYITVSDNGKDFIDWHWLKSMPVERETTYLRHVRLDTPLAIKIDGKKSKAVIGKTDVVEVAVMKRPEPMKEPEHVDIKRQEPAAEPEPAGMDRPEQIEETEPDDENGSKQTGFEFILD